MNVTVAIDSFKGSLTSLEAGRAAKAGILRAMPDARVAVRPLADGGEGTASALTAGMGGEWVAARVTGPLGQPVTAGYGIVRESKTAILEMSSAAGITLVPAEKRNPLKTTTYGVGELIRLAVEQGCRRFLVGIGGSATNDGGLGMLEALGFGMLGADGKPVAPFGIGLRDLSAISLENVMPELAECEFRIACDVTNPLCGPDGCSAVFGPQKGADETIVREMDGWLADYAAIAAKVSGHATPDTPGAGAAGGLGFAFLAFFRARLESGVGLVLRETRLEDSIRGADYVVTGEGRLDAQTVMGKAPEGVARAAKKYGKPVIAFAGSAAADAVKCNEHGIDAYFPVLRRPCTLEEAMKPENAAANLSDTAEQVFRLIAADQTRYQEKKDEHFE
ncbi:MAG: glycerate kinase [Lachnospiraceae bacterium]|jgi:glycerate kinase